ncbi:MAG: D-alanyl-D-alanine carboxypeptidase/D-alanyl-D-alanine-endopeptidase [Deltaproteobacteria bacterium]|nr:D-alanyl-D-alanine carboxypeptidase/D-alanyl-D-alanine-endopeptidase [Deltaproteobacteria bacterium]TLN01991.1 MAG: D-alanyl-D-alanine carboxypeptidase/D-alanyl-D-alanine-endopeptidase [bacterium]
MKPVKLNILAWFMLFFFLGGCASQKVSLTCPSPPVASPLISSRIALKNELDGMIGRELLPYSLASIKVVSLQSGSTLYETNPHLLMPAASVQKLFTAAAVLSFLGSDHSLETSISVNSETATLYLKGCGDPLLSTADLARMVAELTGKLRPGVRYKLIGDTTCFDGAYWGSGWMWDDEPAPEAMYLSALSVNRNTVRVTVAPGKSESAPVQVSVEPPTRYVSIENSGITGKPGGSCKVSVTRPAGERENEILVSGSLAPGCKSVRRRLTVWRPELYTLTLLSELLEKSGVSTDPPLLGIVPADALLLASTRRPISEIISVMLKKSDNLCAENLFKYLAYAQSGQKGTSAGGEKAIKNYLRSQGIPTDRLVIADGSGVSRYNLTNADTIARLLVAASKDQAIFPLFAAALPLAGKDGTLVNRMKGTPAEQRVKAKTGTMQGVSALAGYTVTADGEPVAFAMIVENFVGAKQRVRKILDRIAVLLSTYSVTAPIRATTR